MCAYPAGNQIPVIHSGSSQCITLTGSQETKLITYPEFEVVNALFYESVSTAVLCSVE
jgi:hypothetical protein